MKQVCNFYTFEFTSAADCVAAMGIGWNLGNTLDCLTAGHSGCTAETAWGNPRVTREVFAAVRAAGFGAVRIPVTWAGHFGRRPDYSIDPAWLDRVEEVLTEALSCGLLVILNLHHDGAEMPERGAWLFPDCRSYEKILPCFVALWTQLSRRFSAYGDRLLFEGMNEPHCGDDWNGTMENFMVVNRLNEAFVQTVRDTGGNNARRFLLVPTYAASPKRPAVEAMVYPQDTRLLLSVHAYIPTAFCFPAQEVTWETPRTEWGSEADRKKLTDCFDLLAAQGLPVVIGEMAAVQKPDSAQRQAWATFFIREAAKRGIVCFWWDTHTHGESMGLLDRTACTWDDPALVEAMVAASRPAKP